MLTTIRIGSVAISTYWLMLLIGAVGMGVYTWRHKREYRLSSVKSVVFTIVLTIVGFTGAKLLYILENLRTTLEDGISLGGVSFFGSVFLIPLLMPLLGYLFRLRPSDTMDLCGPCVAIMICCMRFGCFLQGCCGGWEVCIGDMCFTWPTQAIESIGDVAIFALLAKWHQAGKRTGQLYPLFVLLYSSMRFFIEFLRDTPKDWLLLSQGQWYSLGAIVIATVWLYIVRRKDTCV